ncbi:MAG: DUF1579 domain-containing protein [Roseivirga sp.]|nr:DUF1579 domain-containing protein [Roseivirga sp.]
MRLFFICSLALLTLNLPAQKLPCAKAGSQTLSLMTGEWNITATDRTSPGNYEENKGKSTITWGISGCSLHEVYQGIFKSHDYAVEYVTYLSDSLSTQRTFFDSEHSNIMVFTGEISEKSILNYWYRDPEKKRMQVKNEIRFINKNSFENISHLSTDYGKTWQLTHKWVYYKHR